MTWIINFHHLRKCLSFRAVALTILALQSATFLVLLGHTQRNQASQVKAADRTAALTRNFIGSHFLATGEILKLIVSLVWFTFDVLHAVQKEAEGPFCSNCHKESADNTFTAASHDNTAPPLMEDNAPASSIESSSPSQGPPVACLSDSCVRQACGKLIKVYDADVLIPEFVAQVVPLRVLVARRGFAALFLCRMRHAVGLDHKYKEALLMIVPAIVYAIQGLLLIYALKLLDPTVFQVLYQVRILFLAIMMRLVLDFRLSPIRWFALVVLMFGITLAQMGAQSTRAETTISKADEAARAEMENAAATEKTSGSWSMEGTLAALTGGFLSAFSGVFMEFVVKKRGNHFHLSARNVHLAFFSIVYFFIVFLYQVWQPEEVSTVSGLDEFTSTFFEGFTGLVWFLVMLQAIGGILVALVVRYCDNIVKSFSTAFAIVLSGIASVFLFRTPLNGTFLLGSLLVLTSITIYTAKK
ncbi:hypothetical protein LSCM4_05320 [Leishmania orientalis]|uniref:CMP-sialic acid transporter n=1 Tax=Leishmania orientalis TaxID=2249476 RepID=A0A836G9N4_9TRYP|nr:hypothetical protein LSCM4_05320 [Leishmania orientalis]